MQLRPAKPKMPHIVFSYLYLKRGLFTYSSTFTCKVIIKSLIICVICSGKISPTAIGIADLID
jgi:hypothetical protein